MAIRATRIVFGLLAISAVAALSGCSETEEVKGEVVGVVTEVTGDLVSIESFVVIDGAGNSHKFIPGQGMTVAGGPASHLRDHLVSGERVKVLFHPGSNGELIADDVQDVN